MMMTKMTSTIDYKALAKRVAQHAIYADNNADQNNKTWAADLRTVVSLLNGMADARPVAWMHIDGRVVPAATMDQAYRDGGAMQSSLRGYTIPLYTHPAPAVPQAEPKREPLSDEQIDEEATNRQMTAACEDAFYDGVRWAEHSHEIGGSDAE